ncbi:MAG: hypothetical protein RLZZ425_961 [Bacteroidota bacterium]
MSNLLKEAIADAKAVRATALANAKAALEEAFQPKLEAMLAEKLKNEISEGEYGSDEVSETMPMEMSTSDDAMDERMEISDDELNEILAELEGELDEAGQVDPNVPVAPAPVDPMAQAPVAEGDDGDEMVDLQELLDSLNDDESAGEEITEGEEEEDEEPVDEKIEDEKVAESLQFELNEAMSTVQYLRDQLNEVNLLNAKLLYTNKLFNAFNLDQKQKLKVVETFDLAKSIREVKLSYTILSESYSLGGSVVKKTNTTAKTITEGLASKPVASTAPKKELIVENSNVMASRFQKLAGIKK